MTSPSKKNVPQDLTGTVFGRLTVIGIGERNKWGQERWRCLCNCGKEVSVVRYSLVHDLTQSCGCIGLEIFIARAKKGIFKKGIPQDLTGMVFGRLTVVCLRNEGRIKKTRFWLCRCECGKETIVSKYNLLDGMTRSCGCWHRDDRAIRSSTHGQSKTRTYHIWQGMHARCSNPSIQRWKDYGGRGITVCPEWNEFVNFLRDMGECPAGRSIDRFPNNDGNYEPGNCRWATASEQARNKRDRWGGKCERGHVVAGDNAVRVSNGKRGGIRTRCKICLRARQRDWERKKRMEQRNVSK